MYVCVPCVCAMCVCHVCVPCLCAMCVCHGVCSCLLEVVYIVEIGVSKEVTFLKAKGGGQCVEEGLDVLDERVLKRWGREMTLL